MNTLADALEDYLTIRRSLGYKLDRTGRLLSQFVTFCDEAGAGVVTTDLALSWAARPHNGSPAWVAQRLGVVRGFARHLVGRDPRTEVPATGLLSGRSHRATPYLYEATEITQLMAAAAQFPSPLRRATVDTLVGLLAVTGLRVGEAIGLDRGDVDLGHGLLTVRHGKFDKARELPIHPSTAGALRIYAKRRDEFCPQSISPAFFVSLAGTRLLYCNVQFAFGRLVRRAGLVARSAGCRPRLHDLRHTFAVTTLLRWYRTASMCSPACRFSPPIWDTSILRIPTGTSPPLRS